MARENDQDWYDACNPIQGTRGLVPVKYFEIVGKTVRDSGSSTTSLPSGQASAGHDSGYAERTPLSSVADGTHTDRGSLRMSRLGRSGGAMVYGIVMYDFKAERPDELEAKEGEAIIVIAQSNPEWFVAKPITRLGGPGLIPVSFIEIRDMATGLPVPDAQEAVQRAGVPKVEEWKKMAADYKNGSIPLGKLESGPSQLQQGMDRLSMSSVRQSGYGVNGYGAGSAVSRLSASMTALNLTTSSQNQSQQRVNSAYGAHSHFNRRSSPELLAPVRASVPRYCFADDIFWFIVEAQMSDGRHWELSRLYQDFYDLQINLIQEYPLEAGNVKGHERSLPYMPGPVTYVTDNISNGRRANLDEYIKNLLKLGPHVTNGPLVRRFFAPREGDYEIDPELAEDGYRLSAASHSSPARSSHAASPQSSAGNLSHGGAATPPAAQAYPGHAHQRGASAGPASMLRQNSALTQASVSSSAAGSATHLPALAAAAAAAKIKVWFDEDSCVVIRMPPAFRFAELYRKLRERRALERGVADDEDEELRVQWRDEDGRMVEMRDDRDLEEARRRGEGLRLWVTGGE